jgi:hypothetical protein
LNGSVTNWLAAYQGGDRDASRVLWKRYYGQLVRVARTRLRGVSRQVSDEEDVALSAFDSFCCGIEAGRFPNLGDRDGLWRLLVFMTAEKAIALRRFQGVKKRTVPKGSYSVDAATMPQLDDLVSREPTAEFCVQAAETLSELLNKLPDGTLRQIAVYKMEGFTCTEIAERLGCSLSTVERKLRRIRHEWTQEANH